MLNSTSFDISEYAPTFWFQYESMIARFIGRDGYFSKLAQKNCWVTWQDMGTFAFVFSIIFNFVVFIIMVNCFKEIVEQQNCVQSITNLRQTMSRIWTCKEFLIGRVMLCIRDNHYTDIHRVKTRYWNILENMWIVMITLNTP